MSAVHAVQSIIGIGGLVDFRRKQSDGSPPLRVLYLIRGETSENLVSFQDRVLTFAGENLTPLAESVVVAVTDKRAPAMSVIPFRKDLFALISLDGVSEDAKWPAAATGFAGAYISDVAFPVVHERNWPLGERSPGAGLLTLFRKRVDIDNDEFLRRWYEGHTPLTLEVHPNAGYVRNRVLEACEAAGPAGEEWNGIVEEQYDPPADLLKARRFFGGSILKMLPTMLRVLKDVKGFIDYPSIQTWLTSEYRLK